MKGMVHSNTGRCTKNKNSKRVLLLAPRTLRQSQSLVGGFTVVLLSCSCHNSNNYVFIKCAASPTSVPARAKKETKRGKKYKIIFWLFLLIAGN